MSLRFNLWLSIFELQAILRQLHQITPNNLEHKKVKGTPYTCYNYAGVPYFTRFHSTVSCFPDTDHFETSALNDPKMNLDIKRSKVPHLHVTTTHDSQLTVGPAVFKWRAILTQVQWITPQRHWTLKCERYPIYTRWVKFRTHAY